MATVRRVSLLMAFATFALTAVADAQPYGPGPSMMGTGMMMRPVMMGHGSYRHMCNPAFAGFTEWRITWLERRIKPTDVQRSKFDEFRAASSKAAEIMRTACPKDVPATLLGRTEAMEKRMEIILQAVKTVRPTLDAFYATLSDEQKARINSIFGSSSLPALA